MISNILTDFSFRLVILQMFNQIGESASLFGKADSRKIKKILNLIFVM